MQIIGELLLFILNIYSFIIIAQVVISWLVVFGVLNLANPQATNLINLLGRLTDPVMKPIRRFVPALGGIDITPIIVIFGIMLLQRLVGRIFFF
jgi:YggT family protein